MRASEKIAVAASLMLAISIALRVGTPSVASTVEICSGCVQWSVECNSLKVDEVPSEDSLRKGPRTFFRTNGYAA